jgi:DNA-directed RNA polymerase specialized sigma24 family protein
MTTVPSESAGFHTTRWTRVCLAKVASDDGRMALSELCEAYYEPVLTFLRCELRSGDAAREMSHAFFEQILGGGCIHTADPARGRFRSYLLGAVKHFLAHHREALSRVKRGGGLTQVSLEEEEVRSLPDAGLSPDAAFERQWAVTVLQRGMDALQAECEEDPDRFEQLKPLLSGSADHGAQASIAESCGISVPALRMTLHRLRKRLRDCVKREVAGTLEDPALVQEEMQALFSALGGG